MNKFTDRKELFSSIEPFSVKRNGFDLTHQITSCWDMGKLYPISCNEVYPNDTFRQTIQHKMILETLLKPIYSNIKIKFKQFETPYRILWKHWRNYYTRGRKGTYTTNEPKVNLNCESNIKGSLFDYLGFPLKEQLKGDVLVSAFPFVAYDFIYFWNYINPEMQENIVYNIQDGIFEDRRYSDFPNDYFQSDELDVFIYLSRDFYINVDGIPMYTRMLHPLARQPFSGLVDNTAKFGLNDRYSFTHCGLVKKTDTGKFVQLNKKADLVTMADYRSLANIGFLYNVNWERDYFTSAHYNTQLGNPVALSTTDVKFIDENGVGSILGVSVVGNDPESRLVINKDKTLSTPTPIETNSFINVTNEHPIGTNAMSEYLKKVRGVTSSITPNDFRLMWAINMIKEGALLSQKSFEYGNYLQFFFGRSPNTRDLQQPIYRGGFNSIFYTQEVTQMSASQNDSPQGNLTGKGQSVDSGYLDDFTCDEIGLTMTLMCIVPSNISQSSQGVNRMWLRDDSFDYYNPAFAHIGLQEIQNQEIFATGNPDDKEPFAYTGNFDELRYISDTVTSDMRDVLSFWTLARSYDKRPAFNSDYLLCRPSKRIFAVQNPNVPNITGVINYVKIAFRDLPEKPIPSLLDHRY